MLILGQLVSHIFYSTSVLNYFHFLQPYSLYFAAFAVKVDYMSCEYLGNHFLWKSLGCSLWGFLTPMS